MHMGETVQFQFDGVERVTIERGDETGCIAI